MGKLRVIILVLGVFLVAYGVGREWKLKPETRQNHVVHRGEVAEVVRSGGGQVWVAVRKDDSYPIQQAVTRGDDPFLRKEVESNSAFVVSAGEHVRVLGESANNRHVEILDGPNAGKQGWMEFEYLRPAAPDSWK